MAVPSNPLGHHEHSPPFAPPFRYRLLVDSVAYGQNLQTLLVMLYRSTHNFSRVGTSVQYLSHNSSLRKWLYIIPPHRGTKYVVDPEDLIKPHFGSASSKGGA